MSFNEKLVEYFKAIGCSHHEIADVMGVGIATISRYRTGAVKPRQNSAMVERFAHALGILAVQKGVALTEQEILDGLNDTLEDAPQTDFALPRENINRLLAALDVRSVSFADYLKFDPSHVSRILSGQRNPSDAFDFCCQASAFAVSLCGSDNYNLSLLAAVAGFDASAVTSDRMLYDLILQWILNNRHVGDSSLDGFLKKLDSFDLDEYIRAVKFDDIRLPTVPFLLPTSKHYRGIAQMKESELDFIKATVLSRSKDDVMLYSDMPLGEMASDTEFSKKYMFGMAMLLKKGLHIHFIHDVHRPFDEMLLGLEANIPLYMTGQISPYYLRRSQNSVFLHLLKVSGGAALEGSAIAGHQPSGKYYLTKQHDELQYYQMKAQHLLSKAHSLMDIYRSGRKAEFSEHIRKYLQSNGERRIICGGLPLFTLSGELLERVIEANGLTQEESAELRDLYRERREAYEALLQNNRFTLEVSVSDENADNAHIAIPELFWERALDYDRALFDAHLAQTRAFAAAHENLLLKENPYPTFRNISFTIINNRSVVVSKEKSPTIHFIIHHPKLVQAFRYFIPPITDGSGASRTGTSRDTLA